MGETCGTHGENRNMYRFLMVKHVRSYIEDQRADGRIILIWMLNKYNGKSTVGYYSHISCQISYADRLRTYRLRTIWKCHTTRVLDINNRIRHGGAKSAGKWRHKSPMQLSPKLYQLNLRREMRHKTMEMLTDVICCLNTSGRFK
jgi:hypothetical protein